MTFTPDFNRVREIAHEMILDRIEDFDSLAISEKMADQTDLADLGEEEFETFQQAVDEALETATVQVTFARVDAEGGRKLKGWLS
jgi:hypothetical protein